PAGGRGGPRPRHPAAPDVRGPHRPLPHLRPALHAVVGHAPRRGRRCRGGPQGAARPAAGRHRRAQPAPTGGHPGRPRPQPAAAAGGGRRVVDARLVPSYLWSTMNGLADHFTSERRVLDPFPAAALLEFAAARLAVAITVPAGG